jgi:hypothetical protein
MTPAKRRDLVSRPQDRVPADRLPGCGMAQRTKKASSSTKLWRFPEPAPIRAARMGRFSCVTFGSLRMNRFVAGALAGLSFLAVTGLAQAQDLAFTLSNASSQAVINFYTSPADVGDWEEDVLGQGVLDAGSSGNVTIADGRTQCVYDLRFVMESGQELEDYGIDLCELGEYTLYDE